MFGEGLDAVSARIDVLHQKSIEEVAVDPVTYELSVTFSGGCLVTKFVADPAVDKCWVIQDNATRVSLKGCPTGLSIVAERARVGESATGDERETRDP